MREKVAGDGIQTASVPSLKAWVRPLILLQGNPGIFQREPHIFFENNLRAAVCQRAAELDQLHSNETCENENESI